MANPEHEAILRQGVEVWNKWRKDNPDVKPNLQDIKLNYKDLSYVGTYATYDDIPTLYVEDANIRDLYKADLSGADFSSTILSGASLRGADLSGANFSGADLDNADLYKSNLNSADFYSANLKSSNLNNVDLSGASLYNADLSEADLSEADLSGADLSDVNLDGTYFTDCTCGFTIFSGLDLSKSKGIETVVHISSSTIGIDTLFKSAGKIPEVFLRGCGLPEVLVTFLPYMVEDAIQFYSCFISYSHADREFAKRLHDRLQGVGIRCWLDEHQLNPGDKLHSTIYEAIRLYDKVILCCSETALKSWWVEKEFETATSKEQDYAETVLIPITLDNYLFEQPADRWIIGEIKEKRVVQKFINWKDHDAFEAAFKKVVDALRTDGGKPPPPASKLTRRKPQKN